MSFCNKISPNFNYMEREVFIKEHIEQWKNELDRKQTKLIKIQSVILDGDNVSYSELPYYALVDFSIRSGETIMDHKHKLQIVHVTDAEKLLLDHLGMHKMLDILKSVMNDTGSRVLQISSFAKIPSSSSEDT